MIDRKKIKTAICTKIKKLKETGFFSIFISNVLSKIVVLIGNVIVVRILSKNDYGIYAYAINAMSMLYLFNDFGASNTALQYLTESTDDKERQKSILKHSIKIGMIGAFFSGLLILLSPLFYPYEIREAKYITPILFLVPILATAEQFILIVLRANFKNKIYATLCLVKTITSNLFLILLAIKFGIRGAVISQYICTIITLLLGIYLSKGIVGNFYKGKALVKKERKSFMKYAFVTQINSTISSILLYIDTFMIGFMLANSEIVAEFKVASAIPSALAFLPTCVIIYILPYFVKNNKNINWIKTNMKNLIKYGALGYGIISLILIVGSKLIFKILYTEQYYNSILPFIILIIGFFFTATFKIPCNNVLYALRKLKFNLYITITSGVLKIVLNLLFIRMWGTIGVAITTTLINILSSLLGICYIRKVLKKEVSVE